MNLTGPGGPLNQAAYPASHFRSTRNKSDSAGDMPLSMLKSWVSTHFSGYGEEWKKKQEEANALRRSMSPVLQFAFPLKGEKVGIAQMEQIQHSINQSPELQKADGSGIESLVKLDQVNQQSGRASLAGALNLPFLSLLGLRKLHHSADGRLCQTILKNQYPNSPVSPLTCMYLLGQLKSLGIDGGQLHGLLGTLSSLKAKTLHPDPPQSDIPPWIAHTMAKASFNVSVIPMAIASLLLGPGLMDDLVRNAPQSVVKLSSMALGLSQDPPLFKALSQACRLPAEPSQRYGQDFHQKRILALTYGFTQLNGRNKALELLEVMISQGKLNALTMGEAYLQHLYETAHLHHHQASVLSPNTPLSARWNPAEIYLIPYLLSPSTRQAKSSPYQEVFFDLFMAHNEGRYASWLHDPSTDHGKANLRTKEAFSHNGLDYNSWLHYPQVQSVEPLLPNKPLQWKVWDRNPGYDLFQGKYGQSCSSLDHVRGFISLDDLRYTMVQVVELKENPGNKTVGNAMVFWATDDQGLFLVVDNVQMSSPYRNQPRIQESLEEFLAHYSQTVAGHRVPIDWGLQFSRVPLDHLPKVKKTITVLGDTADHHYHLNALVQGRLLYALNPMAKGQKVIGKRQIRLAESSQP